MDIHALLSQGKDQQAITELRKQERHAFEVRFCLGDWSFKTLQKRYALNDSKAQQRLRCDQAFLKQWQSLYRVTNHLVQYL